MLASLIYIVMWPAVECPDKEGKCRSTVYHETPVHPVGLETGSDNEEFYKGFP